MKILQLGDVKVKPLQVFEVLFKDRPYPFLLESGIHNEQYGRYSIMGADPFLRFKSKGRSVEIFEKGRKTRIRSNPFTVLKDLFKEHSRNVRPACRRGRRSTFDGSLPFTCGAVGYFSYDMGRHIERLPSIAEDDLNLPDCFLCFYRGGVVFDHTQKKVYAVGPRAEALGSSLKGFKGSVAARYNFKKCPGGPKPQKIHSNFTKARYIDTIKKAKEHITRGDIYQVNLSQRFQTPVSMHPFELYRTLSSINPAPFSAYLNYGDFSIVSSSPERFLLADNGMVQTRPIKGTRSRGATAAEDKRLAGELLNSEKDAAELMMIVDLERNDLGRVCEYGSVKVTSLKKLERYSTVFHTVATARGRLYKGKDNIDLLKAAFPGGSITGVPKIRAMEIIEELEPTKRSVYTGSIGYMDFSGRMDINIAIRTFILKKGTAYFQVGGGIVADSDPRSEYQETLDKAKALIEAVTSQQS